MIRIDRLMQILDDWALWMKSDNHRLGYPSKSIGLSSGGESTVDSFDEMINIQDLSNVHVVDSVIHSLPGEQQDAIYHRYLHSKKPLAYEYKLDLAMDNLLTIVSKRINA
jgi:hypothetical protein